MDVSHKNVVGDANMENFVILFKTVEQKKQSNVVKDS